MTLIPSAYSKVPLNSQDVRVHANNNDVLAFRIEKKTSIRTFLGRKIAFLAKRLSGQKRPPPLPPRGDRVKSRKLLSPQQSRQRIASQFARSFKNAILQQHQLLQNSMKQAPHGLKAQKSQATQEFSRHIKQISQSFDYAIKTSIEKTSPNTGEVSQRNLSGREIQDVYKQFHSHLKGLDSLTTKLRTDLLKQSPRLLGTPQAAADYEKSPLLANYETQGDWKDDDYQPLYPPSRNQEETFQSLDPTTREKKST